MLKGHPRGLLVLFFANMGERFGYYTMLSIFVYYLQENFGWDASTAGDVYGGFLFAIYFMPLLGGFLADKVLGYGKTIALGTVVMAAGYGLLSVPTEAAWLVFTSLGVISVGNGMFKGNLAVIVGNLYESKEKASLRDAAFNIYYMGINIGAFFAPYAASEMKAYVHETMGFTLAQGYNAAFAVAGVAQVLSLLVFLVLRKHYRHADYRSGGGKADSAEATEGASLTRDQVRDRVVALLIVFGIVIFFWMAFHQNGFTLSLFAKNYTVSQVDSFTYLFFDLPALLAVIALFGGIVFVLRKGAPAVRVAALVVAVAGGGFAAYKYSSYTERPSRDVAEDRMADLEAIQAQMGRIAFETPLSQDSEWIGEIAEIDNRMANAFVEEAEASAPYEGSGCHVLPIKVYRLYNERVLGGASGGEHRNLIEALKALRLSSDASLVTRYRDVGDALREGRGDEAAEDEAALLESIDDLAEKDPLDEDLAPLGESLFLVFQHLARMQEEAVSAARQVRDQAEALGEEGAGIRKEAQVAVEIALFECEVARRLAVAVGKHVDEQYTGASVGQVPGRISPELFQAFNPIFIVFLTPLVVGFFYWLNRRGKEPSSPAKIGIGMTVTAIGFLVMVAASWSMPSVAALGGGRASLGSLTSPYWLVSTYFTLTVAELFLSPMGLSFVSKVAPPQLRGLMQGGWLAATAIGNLLAGLIGRFYESWELWQFFAMLVVAALVSALLVLLVLKKLKAAISS